MLVREFLTWQQDVRGRQASSVYDYATRLQRLLLHLGRTPLGEARLEQLESWITRIRGGRAHGTIGAPASRAKDVAVTRSLFAYLHARGLVERNPATLLLAPTVHNRNPKPVPEDVWRQLWFSECLSDDARVVLGLGFFVGLRRQEIVSLAPSHVDVRDQRLVGFVRKGGGDDVTPYGAVVGVFADAHPQLIGDPDSFLRPLHAMAAGRLGRPRLLDWREKQRPGAHIQARHSLGEHDLDPEWINSRLETWLRASGLSPHAFSPHSLRHSTATYLLRAGVPEIMVANLLNHSSLNVTRRYAKVGGDELALWRNNHKSGPLGAAEFNRHNGAS
jgi:integrase/recombinase XerC